VVSRFEPAEADAEEEYDVAALAPVALEEAPHLQIEISVLTVPKPIRAEDVEVGRHGLLISMSGRRGLLLPQVPVEQVWDRATFLAQTCRKAGLPMDAWEKGAVIEAFTAEVFGEERASE